LNTTLGENSHRWPWFLPDGKHFLYWSRTSRAGESPVTYIGELGSLQAKQLMKSESMAAYASGHLLFLRDQVLMAEPFDPRRMELTGEAQPVAERVAVNGATLRAVFSASENGRLIYKAGEASIGWNLLLWDRDGKPAGSILQSERYIDPVLSPDGTRLAVSIFVGNTGVGDIWTFDLKRETRTRLTFGPAAQSYYPYYPLWSPDGTTIYYMSQTQGLPHIYAKAADGSGSARTVLETEDIAEAPVSFSPDGRYLVYLRKVFRTEAGNHIWALPLSSDGKSADGKPFPIVQDSFDEGSAKVSADGKWMAYQSNESGRREVYITAFPGGGAKWQVSSEGGIAPKWRRDGKELFFLDGSDKMIAVDVNTSGGAVQLGTPHVLFQAPGIQRDFGPYDVTADGKKFIINSGNLKEGTEPMTLVLNWPEELKK
jgi:Tol biopolymer transport system component